MYLAMAVADIQIQYPVAGKVWCMVDHIVAVVVATVILHHQERIGNVFLTSYYYGVMDV